LFDLIRLCLSIVSWLKIDDVLHAFFRENVVACLRSFVKSQMGQEVAQILEMDVSVRCATQHTLFGVFVLAHTTDRGGRYS